MTVVLLAGGFPCNSRDRTACISSRCLCVGLLAARSALLPQCRSGSSSLTHRARPLPPLLRAVLPDGRSTPRRGPVFRALCLLILVPRPSIRGRNTRRHIALRTWVLVIGWRLTHPVPDGRSMKRFPLLITIPGPTADSLYRIQYDRRRRDPEHILVDGARPFVTATITLSTMIVGQSVRDLPSRWSLSACAPCCLSCLLVYRGACGAQSASREKLRRGAGRAHETLGAFCAC